MVKCGLLGVQLDAFFIKRPIVMFFKKPSKNNKLVTLSNCSRKSIVKFDARASFFQQKFDVCSELSEMQAT